MAANHPQMSAALKNIADLNAVYLAHQRESLKAAEDDARRASRSSKKSKKDSKRKDKKSKDKKSKKDRKSRKHKEDKKDKKSRKERKASSSSGSSSGASSSDSDLDSASEDRRGRRGGGRIAQREELERGRTAAECARQILAKFPDVRGDLRGLLRTVDDGEAVAVDGIPDERLRALVAHLFDSLGLARSSKTGAYILPRDAQKATTRLAMIFDMTPEQLAPFERARSPWRGPEEPKEPEEPDGANRDGCDDVGRGSDRGGESGLEGRAMTGEEADALLGTTPVGDTDDDDDDDDGDGGGYTAGGYTAGGDGGGGGNADGNAPPPPAPIADVIGPSARPNPYDVPPATGPEGKRVLGPMVPPRAMLDAAAKEAAAWAAEAIGPAPPEIVEEAELTGMEAKIAAADKALAADADPSKDAYDVLGVPPEEATPAVLKKTYWRMSLLVHPDKCEHPNAAAAFDVVKKAHQSLLDPTERAAMDAAREEKKKMEGFDEWLAGERERAEWRRLQGTPLPTDDEILNGPKPPEDAAGREEWMTKLPPQMRPRAGAPSGNVTSFAARTFVERDASTIADWTDTPKDAATREARLFLEAQEKMYSLPAARAAHDAARAQESEKLVDEFNEKRRPKSLLEQHRERAEKESRDARTRAKAEKKAREKAAASGKKRKKGEEGGEGEDGGDGTGWEYRPWNRDTDLEAGRQSTKKLNPEEMMKKAGGDLKGRFGSGGTARSFL